MLSAWGDTSPVTATDDPATAHIPDIERRPAQKFTRSDAEIEKEEARLHTLQTAFKLFSDDTDCGKLLSVECLPQALESLRDALADTLIEVPEILALPEASPGSPRGLDLYGFLGLIRRARKQMEGTERPALTIDAKEAICLWQLVDKAKESAGEFDASQVRNVLRAMGARLSEAKYKFFHMLPTLK